jgi:hypothetical protein
MQGGMQGGRRDGEREGRSYGASVLKNFALLRPCHGRIRFRPVAPAEQVSLPPAATRRLGYLTDDSDI